MSWVSGPHIAGMAAVLIGAVDHWAFHDAFGLVWDQALIYGGLAWTAGVMVPSPIQK